MKKRRAEKCIVTGIVCLIIAEKNNNQLSRRISIHFAGFWAKHFIDINTTIYKHVAVFKPQFSCL